jgi:hypothetical protein
VLTLHADQMQAAATARFERQLVEVIAGGQDEVRRELATPEGLAALRAQVGRARGHGFSSEGDIASYVITAWILGPDFDTSFGAMRDVLRSSMTPAARIDAMERITETVMATLTGDAA